MKLIYKEHEGQGTYVESYSQVTPQEFREALSSYMISGYTITENKTDMNSFVTLKKGCDMVAVAYYPQIAEMRVVTEPNSAYLTFKDTPCNEKTAPQITQVDIGDPGISYVVRLSDGRFIVFDGGWELESDADKLMRTLTEQTPHGTPIIAAWIMTHPHIDHYRCYLAFEKKYFDRVKIERFIYNFPDAVLDVERLPDMTKRYEHVARFFAAVKRTGAPVYKAHTGQTYELGGAKMEILSSPDDTFLVPIKDFNSISLVIKMTLAGQTVLWTADAQLKGARLAERFGDYLKSDILQVPHHFFVGGDKDTYALINPHTCLVPSLEEHCLGTICLHRKNDREVNRYLIYDLDVQDFYMGGSGDIVLKLPYSPRPNGKRILFDKIETWQKSLGAKSWYFSGITKENARFTFINSIYEEAEIFADLIFEDSANNVDNIKITVPKRSVSKKDLMNPEDADPDALVFNRRSLLIKGVPDGASFTVHFKANMPVIIKGETAPDYYG